MWRGWIDSVETGDVETIHKQGIVIEYLTCELVLVRVFQRNRTNRTSMSISLSVSIFISNMDIIYIYISPMRFIYYGEWAHMIMEAEKTVYSALGKLETQES